MSRSNTQHVVWPVERLYFASVKAPSTRRGRRWLEQVCYAAESQLPIPLEELHAVIADGADGMAILCAFARAELDGLPPEAVTLSPSAVPECIARQVAPEQFNLLTGAFEPRRARLLRRSTNLVLVLSICLLGALAVAGLTRRTSALHEAISSHASATQTVAQRVLEPTAAAGSTQQLFLNLTAELRGLRQTRTAEVVDPELFDAPATLASLLERWPSDVAMRTETLTISRAQITVRADVPASGDVQRLADALAEIPGWQIKQPRVNATSDGASCTITLVPKQVAP